MHDRRLLREYVEHGSQAAFAQLIERYLRLVYSTCLRETGEVGIAEDAAQAVFLLLARKAPTLHAQISLVGWLFAASRLVSRNAMRQERRRRQHEQKAVEAMVRADRDGEADTALWSRIEPMLNDALTVLNGREREALLLRFFQGLSLIETGSTLGISADAAQMRVSRAVEKLRRHLAKAGITVSCAALATLLPIYTAHSLPVGGVAPMLSALSVSGAGVTGPLTSNALTFYQGAMKTMWMTKIKTAAVVAVAAVGVTGAIPLMAHVHLPHTTFMVASRKPVTAASGIVRVPAFDPRAEKGLRQMAAAYQRLTSYSDTTEMLIANGPKAVAALGPSSRPQVRASVAVQKPSKAAILASGSYILGEQAEEVCDGKTFWELRAQSRNYLAQPAPPHALEAAFSGGSPMLGSTLLESLLTSPDPLPGWLHKAVTIKMGKDEVVAGIPVQTVIIINSAVRHDPVSEGSPQAEGRSQTNAAQAPFTTQTKMFLAIGVKDHLLRRLSWADTLLSPGMDHFPGGTVTFAQMETHRNVRANPSIAASTWKFTPPPGFILTDAATLAALPKTTPAR